MSTKAARLAEWACQEHVHSAQAANERRAKMDYRYLIAVNVEKCRGCQTCEVACSLGHFGECNPTRSRIRAIRRFEGAVHYSVPAVCQHCEEPICQSVCPMGAISRHPETGAKVTDALKCVGCHRCEYACPFAGCTVDPETKVSIRCDLCDGDPKCVRFCGYGALEFQRSDRIDLYRKAARAQQMLDVQRKAAHGEFAEPE